MFHNSHINILRDGEDLLELIAGMQSKRMDEQRVTLPHLPGLHSNKNKSNDEPPMPLNQDTEDSFLEMLVKCQVIK